MHPRVRKLYKAFLFLGPHLPTMPMERYRHVVKSQFLKHQDVGIGSTAFKKALAWGRVGLREVESVISVHKFRSLKRNYDWENASNAYCGGVDEAHTAHTRRMMETRSMKVRYPLPPLPPPP
mmetsp:Transcript_41366/g.48036  ORF Transcript_41366/g.48036 Transcript_41366/m.48036 type:complete len:122 (+) Transcript_41366:164-529(+)